MANAIYVMFVLAILTVFGLVSSGPLQDHFRGKNSIDISITENNETVTLKAFYPKAKTRNVNAYIKDLFAPDSNINFVIKSRKGYVEIAMNRLQNSQAVYEKLKSASKGIQQVLAGN